MREVKDRTEHNRIMAEMAKNYPKGEDLGELLIQSELISNNGICRASIITKDCRYYTVKGFKQEFRPPDGICRATLETPAGKVIELFSTDKVICDRCADTINQPKDQPNKPVVVIFHNSSNCLCLTCAKKQMVMEKITQSTKRTK